MNEDAIKQILVENQALIDAGYLDLNQPIKKTNSTFLHTAAWFLKLDLAAFLLAHGADPNAANTKGNTALHFAAEHYTKDKGPKLMSMLIHAGGDPFLKNFTDRKSPVDKAQALHGKQARQWIEDEYRRIQADAEALNTARKKQEWREQLTQEFQTGVAVTPRTAEKEAASQFVDERKVASAKEALRELTTVFDNLRDMTERKAMQVLKTHKKLIDEGYIEISKPIDKTQDTMLHVAVWHGRSHIVKWLLKHGANANSRNIKGNTPMHVACERGGDRTDIVQLLMDNGGNPALTNYMEGKTPLDKASDAVRKFILQKTTQNETAELVEAAVNDMKNLSFAMMKQNVLQEDQLAQKLKQGRRTKESKMIDKAIEAQKKQQDAIKRQQQEQEELLRKKLQAAAGGRKGNDIEDDTRQKLEEMFKDFAKQNVAQQRSEQQAEQDLARKLREGKGRRARKKAKEEEEARRKQRELADGTDKILKAFEADLAKTNEAKRREQQSQEQAMMERIKRRQKRRLKTAEDTLHISNVFATLDMAGTNVLEASVVRDFHVAVHNCNISMELVQTVLEPFGGRVTKQNFLKAVEKLHVACRRHQVLHWDFSIMDTDVGMPTGTCSLASAPLLFVCNSENSSRAKYKQFLSNRDAEAVAFSDRIAFEEFYDALIQ
eukprot:TRINITY_DN22453_c0_g1_i1.p1 TRINITY_DN22453_c0_g1~~TRINITY_DN22453_c0_g1_i1.p1  ORF type:complete len:744 (+),score=417.84 TRINITY_DN22453_c0_g1_i1:246-2234(+)